MADSDTDTVPGSSSHEPRIVHDADTVGGAARIAGTRIRVSDIVIATNYHDLAPHTIAEEYPTVSVPEVHAARAYFTDHTAEIRAEIRDREQTLYEGE
jgi:uncharacterized protein (DUF433 family)